MVEIYCLNTKTRKSFPEGTTLMDMLPAFEFEKPYPILCAKVNNVSQGLKYRAFNSRQVEFLDYTSYVGRSVYCNSLCFLLCKAARDVFPDCRVVLRRPISKGYYCSIIKEDSTPVTEEDLENRTYSDDGCVIEDLITREEISRFCDSTSTSHSLGKPLTAKLIANAVDNGSFKLSQECIDNFKNLFDRIVHG